uniref:Uncharacterized protein n=1 Tax=Anopheles atroparvus TaxID=41427 RepID=A0A182J5Q8_ANOAO
MVDVACALAPPIPDSPESLPDEPALLGGSGDSGCPPTVVVVVLALLSCPTSHVIDWPPERRNSADGSRFEMPEQGENVWRTIKSTHVSASSQWNLNMSSLSPETG